MSENYTPRDTLNGAERDESPTLGALAAALAKAQSAFGSVLKSSEAEMVTKSGARISYNYADLASIWEAIRGPLTANGLAVVQLASSAGERVIVTTTMLHSSGEWIRGRLSMPVGIQTPQGFGSAITYAKKYALAAMVGVAAEEDDDGATASTKPAPTQQASGTPPPVTGKRSAEVKAAARRVQIQEEEPPPPSDADAPPEMRSESEVVDDGIRVPFGKDKGKALSETSPKSLAFLEDYATKAIDDPTKERFRAENLRLLRAVQNELRTRTGLDA